ncbi:MAG: nucleotidyltransferase family protein [Bacillota bacterium]|nr:nucleotidyltransferase family protein [Bacillota bacterium]
MKVDAVILAGADNAGPLRECAQEPYEALISINGRPMVEYVVEAVRQAHSVGRIAVVGPRAELEQALHGRVDLVVERGRSLVENILLGIEALAPQGKVLLVTSDLPLLTPEAIDDFVAQCARRRADVYYAIVARESNEAKYPGVRRTYVRLKEGVFTGGNLVLLEPWVILQHRRLIEQAVAARKEPWQLGRLLGVRVIVKFVLNRLSIAEVEKRVQKKLGFVGAGVISRYPEVGIDVDKPSDLELARRVCGTPV